MSQSSIRWPIAKTPEGAYIKIELADAGGLYQCPECAGRFVARKGAEKRWHFAHYPGVVCTGEGSRHAIAKHLIASILSKTQYVPLLCKCGLPTEPQRVEVAEIKVEDTLLDYRCDITCRIEREVVCLEVVDTNPVQEEKRKALGDRLVEVEITRMSDDEVFGADAIYKSLKEALGHFLTRIQPDHVFIHTWQRPCYRCDNEQSVAMLCDNGGVMSLWSQTIPPEILSQMQKYARLEFRKTSIVREGYMANVCSSCGAVQGDWYLPGELLDLRSLNREDQVTTLFVPLQKTKHD